MNRSYKLLVLSAWLWDPFSYKWNASDSCTCYYSRDLRYSKGMIIQKENLLILMFSFTGLNDMIKLCICEKYTRILSGPCLHYRGSRFDWSVAFNSEILWQYLNQSGCSKALSYFIIFLLSPLSLVSCWPGRGMNMRKFYLGTCYDDGTGIIK